MDDLWEPEAGMWNEPGASGKRSTIRAAYYTVSAYQEALGRLARIGLGEEAAGSGDSDIAAEIPLRSAELAAGYRVLLTTPDIDGPVVCELSERLFDLAKVVHDGPGEGMSTEQIAQALFVAPSSVPKYVQRLNQAVSAALGGAPARLLLPGTANGVSGYAWARSKATG
ncbi:hypothetical protein PS467_32810 [Streptomyces luomodiensis]|uniref:Uncharacterized protein n=1 Tax=Streptomyces luomodiensis TaxID=3026192 RepID=A0ABY9V4Q5_9ACTN|nr:hypothetical protein [Streptomyces sp. SCA4-21]WNE99773.1 hypothetical protein PS467_32810 [Streptomyces sp. SCA4-21]